MAEVVFRHICKTYDKTVEAVKDFNLTVADREFVVFVGPSGCGKSTTLRMVAGLEEITAGELYINGRLVNNVLPKDRDISMVFQNYALFPHMTVYDNIAFPLKMAKMPKAAIRAKVMEAAEILEITELLPRKPKALSGGQRQRVAIGRAIVREPQVFLMDEPLSNLDAKLRSQMRTELVKLRQRINTTFIYVTHDQTEAMTLGDCIVVMEAGHIRQTGTPVEVFTKPQNRFVAGFIGTPQMNFIDAELSLSGGVYRVCACGFPLEPGAQVQQILRERGAAPGAVVLGVRPEHLHPAQEGIAARVEMAELTSSTVQLRARAGETELVASLPFGAGIVPPPHDAPLHLLPETEYLYLFARADGRSLLAD